MKVGVIVPQGWTGEYDGWESPRAWERTVAVARQADRLGFESIWLFDHFHTTPEPTDELTFESFTTLAALASLTERVLLGHVVICNGFRNPALVAKMASTLDTISRGRMQLGMRQPLLALPAGAGRPVAADHDRLALERCAAGALGLQHAR